MPDDTPADTAPTDAELALPDEWQMVRLHRLVKAPWNYKTDDAEKAEKLANNIRRNGQIVNLVVRELPGQTDEATGLPLLEVGDGNHRLDALELIGVGGAVVYNNGECTVEELQRKATEINETSFESDPMKLAALMGQLEEEFGRDDLAETMPFTAAQLDEMEGLDDFDWSEYEDAEYDPDEGGGDTPDDAGGPATHEVTMRLTDKERGTFDRAVMDAHGLDEKPGSSDAGQRRRGEAVMRWLTAPRDAQTDTDG